MNRTNDLMKNSYYTYVPQTVLLALIGIISLSGCTSPQKSFPDFPQIRQIESVPLIAVPDEPLNEPNRVQLPHGDTIELSIEKCRALALQNNLQLQVQVYNPQISDESLREKEAIFEPLFLSQFSYIKTDTPVSLALDASESTFSQMNGALVIPLRTGGRININLPWQRSKTNNQFATLNPAYTNDLSLSLNQELLRGAGRDVTEYAIRVQQIESQRVMAQTQAEAARILAMIDRAYWRLYAAHRQLDVRRLEYQLANAQLERAQRMVKLHEASEIEVLRAETAAAQRLEGIIVADNQLRDRERELKLALNTQGLEMDSDTLIKPTSSPGIIHYIVDKQPMIQTALINRVDLIETELQLCSSDLTIKYAKNGMLPLLTLDYTYNINGLGPTRDDSFDLMLENRFVDHRLGLVLQIPLGNQAARSRYRQSLLRKRQILANQDLIKLQIKREVLSAIDQLESNWQRVLAGRTNSELSKRTLEAEQRQFELGMQHSTEVLDAQTRYADAMLAEINALTEYQISQVDLCYAIGGLNQTARVNWNNSEYKFQMETDQ